MNQNTTKVVIGASFGDEGKGMVVSSLCSQFSDSLVVRYCGGQQAGHHVILHNGNEHVFSNFGSGTLQGHHTYWTKYCTVDPIGILNELDILKMKGVNPVLFIDERCPVTTPYEKMINKELDKNNSHGSCGVGVGQTLQREQDFYSILFGDLYFPSVLNIKLELLRRHYSYLFPETYSYDIQAFIIFCQELIDRKEIKPVPNDLNIECYSNCIFEGSQGLLLDQHYGFFPHVTRANTGTKNILDMGFTPDVFLVTRAYQTRHGNGPMTNQKIGHKIKVNPYENNSDTTFQGAFRRTILDLDLIKYAINKDPYLKVNGFTLAITCLDLIDDYEFTINGELKNFNNEKVFIDEIKSELKIDKVLLSRNPFPELEEY